MNVSAIIVTRGDVNLEPILRSLPAAWEVLVWDNGAGAISRRVMTHTLARIITGKGELPDLAVYGRYAAIEYATNDLIYVQDDDCLVSDPEAIVRRFMQALGNEWDKTLIPGVVCNMPQQFRHTFYVDHCLVGFGACFHRDAPQRAFTRFLSTWAGQPPYAGSGREFFERTCDIVFTALTPRVFMDVPYTNLAWAEDHTRMYRQPGHVDERAKMLELVRAVS